MPEGDTVRRLATRISERLSGRMVERAVLRDPRIAQIDLSDRTLIDADAYGKHLFIRFDDGRTLHAHLLMTGSFEVGRPSREPEWKRRVELWFSDGRLTGLSVPLLAVLPTVAESEIIGHLGPDLCKPDAPPDMAELVCRLAGTPEALLAGAMLDQRIAAGWGNVYAHEVPFLTGVDPMQPVGSIERLDVIAAIGTALIRVNAARGPQNTTGRRLHADERWIHGTGRGRCPVCGGRLDHRSGDHTEWQRPITWCPTCQPRRESTAADLARVRRLIALHPALKEPYVRALV